jgi:hypothetical protein
MRFLIAWLTLGLLLAPSPRAPAADSPTPGVKSWPLDVPAGGHPGFLLMPANQTGITFTNELRTDALLANQNLLNGAGLALGDYDGDGRCDIFLCSLSGTSRLYRNLGGWKFQDVTEAAGLSNSNLLARGAAFADVNGDGHLDLVVTYSGKGTRVFLNDGVGHFHDAQLKELEANTGSMSLALGDVNGDGWLDLYVANYGENTIRTGMRITTRVVNGREQVVGRYRNRLKIIEGHLIEYGEPGAFYLNDGKGGFSKMSWTDGTFLDESGAALSEAPWDLGLTVAMHDINQDGRPDLYVCDDFQDPDRLWLGDGRGHFRAIAREALRSTPQFSMACDFGDINGDGLDDFIVTDMLSRSHVLRMRQISPESPIPAYTRERKGDRPQIRRNFLFLNRGDGTYADIANYAGVAASDWSWSVVFLDVDLDGYPDILVGNGHFYDTQDMDAIEQDKALKAADPNNMQRVLTLFPPLRTPNCAFRNRGNLTFEEVGKTWGFDSTQVSHSIGLADLDNDGDLDVVVNCLGDQALVYRNESSAPRVAVRLKGLPPNTQGIGARIKLLGGAVPEQSQEMTCGGRFLAGDEPLRTFAAGKAESGMTLEVSWRSGKHSIVRDVKANYLYEIDEAFAEPPPAPSEERGRGGGREQKGSPLFEDVTANLGHRHRDPPYDDFSRQKLLPRRLSQLGPGVAWFDLNGDGREDLIIGAGRSTSLGVFLNAGNGRWTRVEGPLTNTLPDDSAGMVAGVLKPGSRSLLVGLAHYETEQTNLPSVLHFESTGFNQASSNVRLNASTGPLAMADVNGDGTLDLFVGGRLQAGRYPEPVGSQLYLNKNGELKPDRVFNELVAKIGLVTSAIFTDLDGDGQMDLVVGNWGFNTPYQQVAPGPWFLYWGDFNDDGEVHLLEAYYDQSLKDIVPWRYRPINETDFPWLLAKFPSNKAYSAATMKDILGEKMSRARILKSEFLGSILLLNRGGKFEPRVLPVEAQWSPAMGLAVGDLDGDGNEDVFISQNYFAMRPEDGRMDAGRGLLLRGDGHGGFVPMAGQTSGIRVYGEQRGCALADYDGDGRLDLVVAQNNDETRLFHNTGAKPGLRVRLIGPAANPDGIGGVIRLEFGTRQGPARDVQAGGGFWSQNSPVQVMGTPERPPGIEVRWPGGKRTHSAIEQAAREIEVSADGAVKIVR